MGVFVLYFIILYINRNQLLDIDCDMSLSAPRSPEYEDCTLTTITSSLEKKTFTYACIKYFYS